jgi:hypothetical protein
MHPPKTYNQHAGPIQVSVSTIMSTIYGAYGTSDVKLLCGQPD